MTDLTATAERERVLRQRQAARYDAVVDSAADPILTFDAQGLVQLANPAAEREFGYGNSGTAVVAARSAGSCSPTMQAAGSEVLKSVVAGKPVHWPFELPSMRSAGQGRNAELGVDASAALWISDSRSFITAIFRDVNERRAAEADLRQLNETLEERVRERTADLERLHEQLRQSQKMEAVGQLTGGIAHDFNNLLTPILGGLDILQRRGVGDERGQRLIEGALQSAERARTLVQRLLAFARRQPLMASAVDVGQIVLEMTARLSGTIGPSIRVVVDLSPDLPHALADLTNQLEMALLNLAVNGRDAMADGGVLTISVHGQLRRTDTG